MHARANSESLAETNRVATERAPKAKVLGAEFVGRRVSAIAT